MHQLSLWQFSANRFCDDSNVGSNVLYIYIFGIKFVLLKVPLTPEIFFRLTYSPNCPEYLCEKIVEIDKIRTFLQPFEVQHS